MDRKILAVILAAGSSSRFGSAKQLAKFDGQVLIERIQTALLSSTADSVAVVLGCNRELILPHILPGVLALTNNDWQTGIASSVRCAAKHAQDVAASHLMLFVCDQPYISTCLVDRMITFSKFDADKLIACRYADAIGVPALFPKSKFDALLKLEGDRGAKAVIQNANSVECVDFPAGTIDIDCKTDLKKAISN